MTSIQSERAEDVVDVRETRDTDPSLKDVRTRRSELRAAMTSVTEAIAAPADGAWFERVRRETSALQVAFERHVGVHEGGQDALHGEILRTSPHLAPLVNRLQRDHRRLEAGLAALVQAVETMDEGLTTDIKLMADDLVGQLKRHRRRGADLFWEAFNHDLGGEH